MDYKHKLITVDQALEMIKSGDVIVSGMVTAEPRAILSRIHELDNSIKNVTVTNCLPMLDADYFTKKEHADRFNVDSWFYSSALRKGHENGNVNFMPNHLHLAALRRLDYKKTNIYMGNATPPDEHGFVSLSLSNVYEKRAIEDADLVILEINPELPDREITEKDKKIGEFIPEYINDGDCLQLGIGGIPNAVANALVHKKNLGVHTEMLTTGFMKLFKAGAVTNKLKNNHRGKMVCCFALGTRELYDFIDNNPGVQILDGSYVNDPYVIAQNDNQVSVNSTIEIDLTGQCCSESIGSRQFSGTGGQSDTAVGAQNSKNGRSFIALYSTAMVRNKETGEREEVSKIVAQLKPGAAVSLSRNDVHYVATEYGVANLRGKNIQERVEALVKIAHPKFRDGILNEAIELGIYVPKGK